MYGRLHVQAKHYVKLTGKVLSYDLQLALGVQAGQFLAASKGQQEQPMQRILSKPIPLVLIMPSADPPTTLRKPECRNSHSVYTTRNNNRQKRGAVKLRGRRQTPMRPV